MSTKYTSVKDDYVVFPKLDPQVLQTIISADSLLHQDDAFTSLPHEIYQRLDQIYGLPFFNYETTPFIEAENGTNSQQSSLLCPSQSTTIESILFASSERDNNQESDTASIFDSALTTPVSVWSRLPPFERMRVYHIDPLVIGVDEFFTPEECDRYVAMSSATGDGADRVLMSRSPTVGKDAAAKAQRTSTTWYHHYASVPELMAKACRLLGLDTIDRWEEPQTVRYRRNEKFTWHLDALGPGENKPSLGGQRTATLLVYLSDLQWADGGATIFRDLESPTAPGQPLRVQPRKGSALLFFPAAGGIPNTPYDIRTLHCGEVVSDKSPNDKWIAQLWLRESSYRPTAPPGNDHRQATAAIMDYCASF